MKYWFWKTAFKRGPLNTAGHGASGHIPSQIASQVSKTKIWKNSQWWAPDRTMCLNFFRFFLAFMERAAAFERSARRRPGATDAILFLAIRRQRSSNSADGLCKSLEIRLAIDFEGKWIKRAIDSMKDGLDSLIKNMRNPSDEIRAALIEPFHWIDKFVLLRRKCEIFIRELFSLWAGSY